MEALSRQWYPIGQGGRYESRDAEPSDLIFRVGTQRKTSNEYSGHGRVGRRGRAMSLIGPPLPYEAQSLVARKGI